MEPTIGIMFIYGNVHHYIFWVEFSMIAYKNILLTVGILSSGEDNDEIDDIEMTYSIMSFPNDVQLCLSSIPGHKLGVCSKEYIPAGTWIGPYEGRRVPNGMLPRETVDSGFSWEVRYTKWSVFNNEQNTRNKLPFNFEFLNANEIPYDVVIYPHMGWSHSILVETFLVVMFTHIAALCIVEANETRITIFALIIFHLYLYQRCSEIWIS